MPVDELQYKREWEDALYEELLYRDLYEHSRRDEMEAKAWQYHVLHKNDPIARRHIHEDDWPAMFRFSE